MSRDAGMQMASMAMVMMKMPPRGIRIAPSIRLPTDSLTATSVSIMGAPLSSQNRDKTSRWRRLKTRSALKVGASRTGVEFGYKKSLEMAIKMAILKVQKQARTR
jgi:hypothetical protein